jgi:large subunit ribosomal protein L29
MKIKEFRDSTSAELITRRTNMKHEIINLRMQQKSGQMENTARIKNLRRAIARIETVLTVQRQAAVVAK